VEEAAETTRRGREEVEVEWTLLLHIPLSDADFGDRRGEIASKPLYAEIYTSFAALGNSSDVRAGLRDGWDRVVLTITPRTGEIQGRRK
jgi:hypothetical protein